MGALLCVLIFPPKKGATGTHILTLTATTDNQGNSAALSKLTTTKFPLCAIMMQLASTVAKQGRLLKLNWAPREQNAEAEELSNGKWHRFGPKKSVDVAPLLKKGSSSRS